MKTLSLQAAISLLHTASAVIVDDSYVTFAGLDLDDDEDVFLTLSHDDPEGLSYSEQFNRADNQTVEIDGRGRLIFTNTQGDKTAVQLLTNMRAE